MLALLSLWANGRQHCWPTSDMIAVLLADDHAVVRAGIRQFLEQAPDISVVAEALMRAVSLGLIEAEIE